MNAKESVLDVLMYLFEHYLDEDSYVDADRDALEIDLMQAGFAETEVVKAFNWLESLASDVETGTGVDTMPESMLDPGTEHRALDAAQDLAGAEAIALERRSGFDVRAGLSDASEPPDGDPEEAIVLYSSPRLSGGYLGAGTESPETAGEGGADFGHAPASRVYSALEMDRLDARCRGFILFAEQAGVLDPATRERVIDRVMALEADDIDLEQLKWVLLMVLFNQPGRESMYAWMEEFVFDHEAALLH